MSRKRFSFAINLSQIRSLIASRGVFESEPLQLGAGLARASGVGMDDGLTKDLTERAIKDTTTTAIHGGKLVPILASGAIESAAGHFGKTKGEELKTKIEAERVRSQLVLQQQSQHEEPLPLQESSEQEREARRKAKGKGRVQEPPITAKEEPIANANFKEKQRGGYKIRLEGLEEQILMGHQTTGSQKTIAQHGLIGSQAREQRAKEISVAEKILDFFMPAAYADEIPTEKPGSLIGEQSSSSRHYQVGLPGPKTFAEFYSTSKVAANPSSWLQQYGETLQAIEQEELALSQATVKTLAGGFTGVVTGGVKAAKEIAATIYKLGRHATNLELLNNPEYEGVLSDEVKVKLQQEVAHTHEKIDVIVKNPGAFGKAVLTHYKMGFTEGVEKFGQGDFFGAGKQFGEMLVDVVPIAAGGYGAAKTGITVASKLSVRALDLAGSSSKAMGKLVIKTAQNLPKDPMVTFRFNMKVQKVAFQEAIANGELTGKGVPIIHKTASNAVKGAGAESVSGGINGWFLSEQLPSKLPGNHGFDGVFLKKTTNGVFDTLIWPHLILILAPPKMS